MCMCVQSTCNWTSSSGIGGAVGSALAVEARGGGGRGSTEGKERRGGGLIFNRAPALPRRALCLIRVPRPKPRLPEKVGTPVRKAAGQPGTAVCPGPELQQQGAGFMPCDSPPGFNSGSSCP
jgi:hypothetical protein